MQSHAKKYLWSCYAFVERIIAYTQRTFCSLRVTKETIMSNDQAKRPAFTPTELKRVITALRYIFQPPQQH